jgi:hypothetical protein
MNSEQFLAEAYRLSAINDTNRATSLVYSHINGLLSGGQFAHVDALFTAADPQRLTVDAAVGFLAISWGAKPHLEANGRGRFATQVRELVRQSYNAQYAAEVLERFE